jgi:hypothetical protein
MTFRNSLIKVDGFSNDEEFENFVDRNNFYLNNILKAKDLSRHELVTKNRGVSLRDDEKFLKQT